MSNRDMPGKAWREVARPLFRQRQILVLVIAFCMLTCGILPARNLYAATGSNPIVAENSLPGTTSWELTKPDTFNMSTYHYPNIEGYAGSTSALPGDMVQFYVSTSAPSFQADIYRMGWYGGTGGRLVQSISNVPGKSYPVPGVMGPDTNLTDSTYTGLIEANWPAAFSVTIPANWVSGMYMVKLTASTGYQSYVPLVIRDPNPRDLLFVDANNTASAYNYWGRKSLYTDIAVQRMTSNSSTAANYRAVKVSFNRPYSENYGAGHFFNWEYDMVRWMERNGYDVSYTTDDSIDSAPNQLLLHKGVVIVGHSEYWSFGMRQAYDNAVAHDVSLAVFSGNTSFHKVRYEHSVVDPSASNRVIVRYPIIDNDPLGRDPIQSTQDWRSSIVNMPEQSLLGEMYSSDQTTSWTVTNPVSPLFAGTNVQSGYSVPGLVGYEYDKVFSNYPIPPGLTVFADTAVSTSQGTDNAMSSAYVAPGGARVVDMGTIQWSWGLDSFALPHGDFTSHAAAVNATVQRVTANILDNFVSGSSPSGTATASPVPTITAVFTPTASPVLPTSTVPTATAEIKATPSPTVHSLPTATFIPTLTPMPATTPHATSTPTLTPITTRVSVTVSKKQIAPGQRQTITIRTEPNTTVHIRVEYPNGDHQSHGAATNSQGVLRYSYVQGGSKVTHNHFTPRIIVTIGNGRNASRASVQYRINFGRLDVSLEPRLATVGEIVNIYVHARAGIRVESTIYCPTGRIWRFRAGTGPHGFAHWRFKVQRGLTTRQNHTFVVVGQTLYQRPNVSGRSFFTVR